MTALLDSRLTLLVVGLVGMAMCSAGIGRVAATGHWLDPLSIVGYVLGVAALGAIVVGAFGWHAPLIDSSRQALYAVLAIIVLKIALTAVHHL